MVQRFIDGSMFIFFGLMISVDSWAYCLLSFDPKTIDSTNCPALDTQITNTNLTALQETLDRLYHSRDVQGSGSHCAKMADLVQAICKSSRVITSFYNGSESVNAKRVAMVTKSSDYRLVSPTLSNPEANYLLPGSPFTNSQDCYHPGKAAITLTPTCGVVHRCESRLFYQYTGGVKITTVNGRLVATTLDGLTVVEPTLVTKKLKTSYPFFGSCSADTDSKYASLYDQIYVTASPLSVNPKTPPVSPFCSSDSTSCTRYDIPLLSQNSVDLLRLVSAKTRIAHPRIDS